MNSNQLFQDFVDITKRIYQPQPSEPIVKFSYATGGFLAEVGPMPAGVGEPWERQTQQFSAALDLLKAAEPLAVVTGLTMLDHETVGIWFTRG